MLLKMDYLQRWLRTMKGRGRKILNVDDLVRKCLFTLHILKTLLSQLKKCKYHVLHTHIHIYLCMRAHTCVYVFL